MIPRTTQFVPDARYDKMIEAFGGTGVYVTTPDDLKRAVLEAIDSRKPTLINAVIDPAAGKESGNIGFSIRNRSSPRRATRKWFASKNS